MKMTAYHRLLLLLVCGAACSRGGHPSPDETASFRNDVSTVGAASDMRAFVGCLHDALGVEIPMYHGGALPLGR